MQQPCFHAVTEEHLNTPESWLHYKEGVKMEQDITRYLNFIFDFYSMLKLHGTIRCVEGKK